MAWQALLTGLPGSLFAAPLVPFRRQILSFRPPFARRGYLAAVAYGPILISPVLRGGPVDYWIAVSLAYEVLAALVCALFILIGRDLGVFDPT